MACGEPRRTPTITAPRLKTSKAGLNNRARWRLTGDERAAGRDQAGRDERAARRLCLTRTPAGPASDDSPSVAPVSDPADVVASLVDQRASQLAGAINAHIVPTGTSAAALHGRVRLSPQITTAQTTSATFAEENPYIGPTLDRLDETQVVLNDMINSTPPPPPPPPFTRPAPVKTATPAAARCTLRPSNRVLVAAQKGRRKKGAPRLKRRTLTVTVKCDQAAQVKLTGTLTQLLGKKARHGKQRSKVYRLGPVSASVKAARSLTLAVRLPAGALTAPGKGAKESAAFTVTATSPNGTGRATARIARLRRTR